MHWATSTAELVLNEQSIFYSNIIGIYSHYAQHNSFKFNTPRSNGDIAVIQSLFIHVRLSIASIDRYWPISLVHLVFGYMSIVHPVRAGRISSPRPPNAHIKEQLIQFRATEVILKGESVSRYEDRLRTLREELFPHNQWYHAAFADAVFVRARQLLLHDVRLQTVRQPRVYPAAVWLHPDVLRHQARQCLRKSSIIRISGDGADLDVALSIANINASSVTTISIGDALRHDDPSMRAVAMVLGSEDGEAYRLAFQLSNIYAIAMASFSRVLRLIFIRVRLH